MAIFTSVPEVLMKRLRFATDGEASEIRTLTGHYTQTMYCENFIIVDPGGAVRNWILPAEENYAGEFQVIKNTGSLGEIITVLDDASATIDQLDAGESGLYWCSGAAWYLVMGSNVVSGATFDSIDVNGIIDQDCALLTAVAAFDNSMTIKHATNSAQAIATSAVQLTTSRTSGTVTGHLISTTSLAGDSGGQYTGVAVGATDGGGSAVHSGVYFLAGNDYDLDFTAVDGVIKVKADDATSLSITDAVAEIVNFDTSTGAHLATFTAPLKLDGAVDVNAAIDADVALTGTSDALNLSATINHATQSAEGLDVSIAQLTATRTTGNVIAAKLATTSLVADTGGSFRCLDISATDGGGTTPEHIGIYLGAGNDNDLDSSDITANWQIKANDGASLTITDGVSALLAYDTTTGTPLVTWTAPWLVSGACEFDGALQLDGAVDLNSTLDMDVALTGTGDGANISTTINHATQAAEALDVSIAQLTAIRASGNVVAGQFATTSLAADTGGSFRCLSVSATDGGGTTPEHVGLYLGTGNDNDLDSSDIDCNWAIKANDSASLVIGDGVSALLSYDTTTGTPLVTWTAPWLVSGAVEFDSALDVDSTIDQDVALTGTGDGTNVSVTINHATQAAEGLDVSIAQLTAIRASGNVIAGKFATTSLAADTGGEFRCVDVSATDGGGTTPTHIGVYLGAGNDADLDSSDIDAVWAIKPNDSASLVITDSVSEFVTLDTTTGTPLATFTMPWLVSGACEFDAALDVDSTIDQDATLTGAGTMTDMALAYNSATGASVGVAVANTQTSTARTGDNATGLSVAMTSLAGDINSVEYNNLSLSVTDGGGTVTHNALDFGAGFDSLMDLTACATGEADIILRDHMASALQIREAANLYLTCVTTNSSESVAVAQRLTTTDGVASGTARVVGGRCFSQTQASSAVTNTTTETYFDQGYTFPADSLKVGTVIKMRFQGIATATNGADTLLIKYYIGPDMFFATAAVDVDDNDIWVADIEMTVRTIGATGTFVASASYQDPDAAGTAPKWTNTASTVFDSTGTLLVRSSATWSAASTLDSCRQDQLNVSTE